MAYQLRWGGNDRGLSLGNGRSIDERAVAQEIVIFDPKGAGLGDVLQVVSEGAPVIVNATVPDSPPCEVRLSV